MDLIVQVYYFGLFLELKELTNSLGGSLDVKRIYPSCQKVITDFRGH